MEMSLFSGSTINIAIGFAILAFALVAIFTNSTPVKWIASLLAITGAGILYRRVFPSDSEIKRKHEENQAAANKYYEDRKDALKTIHDNKKKVKQLKEEKIKIGQEDEEARLQAKIVDTEIEQLEKQSDILEKSVDERQEKLNTFFSRKDKEANAAPSNSNIVGGISGFSLKGDVEE